MMARLVILLINEKDSELKFGELGRFMWESGRMIDSMGEED